ncbi:MAG: ABC transporter permease [Phycisphaerales bacterium]
MQTLWQDTRYGLRMLGRSPGFTAVVVVILAIGIGANTAIFSVVNAVMLRPLPYKDSHRLVTIWDQGLRVDEGFRSRSHFLFLRENHQVFESLGGYCGRLFYVSGIEKPHEAQGCEVTANLFSVLGIQPVLGRGFLPEEERAEGARAVILSHAFWKEHFGGSGDALGRSMSLGVAKRGEDGRMILESESYTIIGVMPPGFSYPFGRSVPFWRPIILTEAAAGSRPIPIFPVGRLKKGVTLERATADMAVLADRLSRIDPKIKVAGARFGVQRFLDGVVEGHRKLPLLLLGAAGFVLLIACSNVANLFLARAAVRQREMAVRLALGASRGRVMCQMLTESLLLSLGAGIGGLLLTFLAVKGLVRLCPSDTPRLHETSVDLPVLGFTLGVSVLTGLLFGMLPAWRASDVGVSETLKEGAGRTTKGRGWRRLHGGLVVSQLALSLILLIGATLLIRSLMALQSTDLGFRPQNVLAASIWLPTIEYEEAPACKAFFQSLLDRVRGLPHVHSAALADALSVADALASQNPHETHFSILGRADSEQGNAARWVSVTTSFFETLGVRLLRGRTLSDEDPGAVVIDETLVQRCFPDTDPIGQRLITDGRSEYTIVGVVETVRSFETLASLKGTVYDRVNDFSGRMVLLIETDGDPLLVAPSLQAQVAELEKDKVIRQLEPLETTLSRMLAPRRFVMILLTLFAGIALIVATIGIYGLLQYGTTQQTRHIGIRMALGARKIDILMAILRHGLALTLVGVAAGLAGALALTRILSTLLYEVTPTDPLTLAGVSLLLGIIALSASYIPARRAARTDPMVALRCE